MYNRNHPYERKNNFNNNNNSFANFRRSNNNSTLSNKKYVIRNSKAEFFIHPHSMHNLNQDLLSQPEEIGFILSEKRLLETQLKKTSGLRYLVLPEDCNNCNFDLTLGISKFIEHIPHQHHIDALLKWIIENKERLINKDNPVKPFFADFMCWRGLLTTVLNTPYEKQKDWMFSITLYKGTYYLCEIETESHKQERLNMDERSKNFTYWGFKFESYVTSDTPNQSHREIVEQAKNETPDQENNYGTVVKTNLSNHCLVYAAEVDCCSKNEHTDLNDYCELKTSRGEKIEDLNLHKNPKYFKWYIQSHLVGTNQFHVGLRDDAGIVNKIIKLDKSDLLVNKRFNDKMCFNFLSSFLDLIKEFCKEDGQLYVARRELNSESIHLYKLDQTNEEYSKRYFMHSWYTQIV